jgi:hypothetical protein
MFLGRFFNEDRLKDGDGIVKKMHKKRVSRLPSTRTAQDLAKFRPICPHRGSDEASKGIYCGHGQKKTGAMEMCVSIDFPKG